MFGPRYSLTQGQKLLYLYSIDHEYQSDTKDLTNDLFAAYISCNYTSVRYLDRLEKDHQLYQMLDQTLD